MKTVPSLSISWNVLHVVTIMPKQLVGADRKLAGLKKLILNKLVL